MRGDMTEPSFEAKRDRGDDSSRTDGSGAVRGTGSCAITDCSEAVPGEDLLATVAIGVCP